MNTVIIIMLALAVCLLTWLLRGEQRRIAGLKDSLAQISKEKQEQDEHWRAVYDVIQTCAGGLNKRISEHVEITDVIQSQAPELLQGNDGLSYWLSANNQFFHRLHDVTKN